MGAEEMPSSTGKESLELSEQLEMNRERLNANLERLNSIPEEVLNSQEGQEEIKSLKERISQKFSDFKSSLLEKASKLNSEEAREKMVYVVSASMMASAIPAMIQMARSKWPEIGVALDAAPDALQQVIHMDLFAKAMTILGEVEEGTAVWQNSGIEVNNLLADISSGKESVDSLSQEQLSVLADGMTFEKDFNTLLNPNVQSDKFAGAMSGGPVAARAFGNMGTVAGAGIAAGVTLASVGAIASKFNKSK